jgi:hypothetical protein
LRVVFRLRFGLPVRPALEEWAREPRVCGNANAKGEPCGQVLDVFGCHALNCAKSGAQERRHGHIVRALAREFARYGVKVDVEEWVDGLAKKQQDGSWKEARLDLLVRDGTRVWYVDFSCFHPFAGPQTKAANRRCFVRKTGDGWSLEQRARIKHSTYRTTVEGRRMVEGRVVPLIANSFSAVGKEGLTFFEVLYGVAKKRGREVPRKLDSFVQSLVAFFTAQNLLAAYRSSG